MAWNAYIVSSNGSGEKVKVDASAFPWARSKNHGESGRATFHLGDSRVADVIGLQSTYPGQKIAVLDWDGTAVYAGFIWEAEYDYDTKVLTCDHADIWSLWERRYVLGDRTANAAKSKLTYSGLTLTTIAKRVVQAGTTGENYGMPIFYPADLAGGSSRTYYGYDMLTVADALQDLMDADGGPDIDFSPQWLEDGTLGWTMRAAGDITFEGGDFDFAAEDPGARKLKIRTSAKDLTNRVYGIGEGTEVDTLVRVSTSANLEAGIALETAESFKDVKSGAELQSLAQEAIRVNNGTTRQAGFEVLAGGVYPVSSFRPGMIVRWNVRNDPYFTEGYRPWECIKYSGSLDDWVTLEFQSKEGG